MATNIRDPRGIITPDAFEVSEALLGLPLAPPARRLWAILIDLMVIGVITVVTSDFRLIIWGVVGLFFLQLAFRRPGTKFSKFTGFLFRGATGCLGLIIMMGVGIGWLAISFDEEEFAEDAVRGIVDGSGEFADLPEGIPTGFGGDGDGAGSSALGRLGSFAAGLGRMAATAELSSVADPEEAEETLLEVYSAAYDGLQMRGEQLVDFGATVVPDDAPFTDDPSGFGSRVLREWAEGRGIDLGENAELATAEDSDSGDASVATTDDTDPLDVARAVSLLTPSQVIGEWAARVENGDTLASDYRAVAVQTRVAELVAGDSLQMLERRSERLAGQLDDARSDLAHAEMALESGETGFAALLRDIWEQLGSGFGLWSIYFTVMLTLFRGRTIGKMITRTRVVRLDGEPLNWWASFERCGGYFAGIATGLLGFAQVYWDPNRQCVHDKIGGTAVVMDGIAAEPGAWQEAAGHGHADSTSAP